MSDLRIDHVVYAVADLEAAAARLERDLGLASVAGGRHPGWGTANRIVPLGPDYLELVTVVDEDEAAASPFGAAVQAALAEGRGPVGWAVATDDIEAVARRLGLVVADGARTRPDGSVLRWRLAGVGSVLPFFIQWDVAEHPGRAPATHRVQPDGIAWVKVGDPDGELDAWLADDSLPVRTVAGASGLAAVGIRSSAGELTL